jgi:hypothetical protein
MPPDRIIGSSLCLPDYPVQRLLSWDATSRNALLDPFPTLYPDEHGINNV